MVKGFNSSRVKGVLLDLDNTIYDALRAYNAGLERIGLDENHPEFIAARTLAKKKAGKASASKCNRVLYFKSYLEMRGEFSPTRLFDLLTRYEAGLLDEIRKQEKRLKRRKTLIALADRYPVAIVTNEVCRMQALKLSAIDATNSARIELVTSEEVGCEKPNAKIFRTALHRLGGLKPSDCVMVGDNLEADIHPALSLGMQAVHITEFTGAAAEKTPKGAHRIGCFQDLAERLLD